MGRRESEGGSRGKGGGREGGGWEGMHVLMCEGAYI